MRIGVYTRISHIDQDDSANEDRLGVLRQEKRCRRVASDNGWTVARVFEDNDFSAYKHNVTRPQFETMLKALAAGDLDGIVVYDLDRLARKPKDLERLVEIFETRQRDRTRPPLIFATAQGGIDLSTPDGLAMARVMITFAAKSSSDISRRISAKHDELRENGMNVGGPRPFGWMPDKVTLDPRESEELRHAAKQLLDRISLRSIVRDLDSRGVTTARGKMWTTKSLRQMLSSPRIAGFRLDRTTIARDSEGEPIRGVWEPILTVEEWEAVCDRLEANGHNNARQGARRYLLSGLLVCGSCFGRMSGAWINNAGRHKYFCGCGHLVVHGPKVDGAVTRLLKAWLARAASSVEPRPWDGADHLAGIEKRRKELMRHMGDGTLDIDVTAPEVQRLGREIKRLHAERAEHRSKTVPTHGPDAWDGWTTEQRRAEITRLATGFVVLPAERRGAPWSDSRLQPLPRPGYGDAS